MITSIYGGEIALGVLGELISGGVLSFSLPFLAWFAAFHAFCWSYAFSSSR
jgi:hypothetical protein